MDFAHELMSVRIIWVIWKKSIQCIGVPLHLAESWLVICGPCGWTRRWSEIEWYHRVCQFVIAEIYSDDSSCGHGWAIVVVHVHNEWYPSGFLSILVVIELRKLCRDTLNLPRSVACRKSKITRAIKGSGIDELGSSNELGRFFETSDFGNRRTPIDHQRRQW